MLTIKKVIYEFYLIIFMAA